MSNRDPTGDPTEPESSVYPSDSSGGVISGEAVPPDEHTRRVAAMKAKEKGLPEPTILKAHDQPTKTAVPVADDLSQEVLLREARSVREAPPPARKAETRELPGLVRAYSGPQPRKPTAASPFGPPRAASRADTDVPRAPEDAPGFSDRGSGEATLAPRNHARTDGEPGFTARPSHEATVSAEAFDSVVPGDPRTRAYGHRDPADDEPTRSGASRDRGSGPDRERGAREPERERGAREPERERGAREPERERGAREPERERGARSSDAEVDRAPGARTAEDPVLAMAEEGAALLARGDAARQSAGMAAGAGDPPASPPPDGAGSGDGASGGGGEQGSVHATVSPEQSSRVLAERSRRERRRERDRRAEKAALRAVVFIFLGLGGLGIVLVNSDLFNGTEETTDPTPGPATKATKRPEKRRPVRTSGSLDETPDLPALRMLRADGLTIAAEGLPEVTTPDEGGNVGVLASIETCRYAYGVWEFSPNKRFRFLTTCEGIDGQIMVGAYEIQGSVIRMSPLRDGPATMISEFEVEKPSTMTTVVEVDAAGRVVTLTVNQRVTSLRGGLQGEAFRDTYAPRNTVVLPGRQPGPRQEPAPGSLRELLNPR